MERMYSEGNIDVKPNKHTMNTVIDVSKTIKLRFEEIVQDIVLKYIFYFYRHMQKVTKGAKL